MAAFDGTGDARPPASSSSPFMDDVGPFFFTSVSVRASFCLSVRTDKNTDAKALEAANRSLFDAVSIAWTMGILIDSKSLCEFAKL